MTNTHSYKTSGYVGKSIDISQAGGALSYTVRGKKGKATTFQVSKGARRANKAIRGATKGVRKDLVKAAVARASVVSKAIVKGSSKK